MLSGRAVDSETVVLIVEDDIADKNLLRGICRGAGFTLENMVFAATIEEVTLPLKRGLVDLVLLDLGLEGASDDPTPAIMLLERWESETKNKKIPVIVISRLADEVKEAARASCFAVIPKPGASAGERAIFSDYLEHVIREAIAKTSAEATFWDRIRQQLDRIVSQIVPGSPHVVVAPGVHWPVTSSLGRAGVAVFIFVCNAVALYVIAKSKGWSNSTIVWLFIALLLAVFLWAVIPKKQSH